jgi:hypothetical protein
VVNASRPGVIFVYGKTGCGKQIEKFNLKDDTGVGQVCLGSRFGRLGWGFQFAFCYGHGNNVRRPSVGASGQKRKGKPWVRAVECQLGWAIFHKSRMWEILGLAVGVAFRITRVWEISVKTVGFGRLASHGVQAT